MIHSLRWMTALGLAVAPVANAAAEPAKAPPADVQAKFEQAAQKICNRDLDDNKFGTYSTIEECVADKAHELDRAYTANPAAAVATAAAQTQSN